MSDNNAIELSDHVRCLVAAGWIPDDGYSFEPYYCEICQDRGCSNCDDGIYYEIEEAVWQYRRDRDIDRAVWIEEALS